VLVQEIEPVHVSTSLAPPPYLPCRHAHAQQG